MVDHNRDHFQYKPLSKANQQIRLLRFKNVPLGPENYEQKLLKCTMVAVSLGSNPDYRTLSYVWGDDTQCKPLVVDGKLMLITASLDIALRHLLLFQDLLKQYIWIDAVCINQTDNEEKAWQVRMMKDIYLNAKSSIGWLGLPDEVSRLAFKTAWECELYKDFAFAFDEWEIVKDLMGRVAEDIVFAPASGTLQRQNAVRLLLDRPFFARTWIHQEVIVAKHIDLVCGMDVCDWDALHIAEMSMAKYFGDSGYGAKLDGPGWMQFAATTGPILGSMGPKCFQLRFYFEENHLAYNLWPLVALSLAGGARCSNHRDAIYGLLSVAADANKLKIYPDYDAPVEKCYIETAKAFLRRGHLDVLTACQQPRSGMRLPSWVPDFSTRWDDDYNVVTPIEHMAKAAEDIARGTLFCAGKGSSPNIFSSEKPGQQLLLCLAGIKVDTIKRVAPPLTRDHFYRLHTWTNLDVVRGAFSGEANAAEELHSAQPRDPNALLDAMLAQIKSLEDLLRLGPSKSPNSMETILRVLTRDLEVDAQVARQGGKVLHRLPPATLKTYIPFVTMLQQSRRLLPLLVPPFITMQKEFFIFYEMILRRNIERRAFVTSEGRPGVGPAILREGDVVAIFCGTEVPLLLRPCDGGAYELIGEAYVDGIMDGEVMEKDPKIEKIEKIEIC
jgi:hypothetical protein